MTRLLVPSLTTPGLRYTVEREGDRLWCDCPRAGFLKAGEECGHMGLVRRADALLQKCAEAHGLELGGRLCRQCLVALLAMTAGKVRRDYITKVAAKEKVAAARKKRVRKKAPVPA